MNTDWRRLREERPSLFKLIVAIKVARTRVGVLAVAGCMVAVYLGKHPPLELTQPNLWIGAGLVLIAAGAAFRFAAQGLLKKKEVLATEGVYSLCRHPLYLGSILITYGFCCLFHVPAFFVVATVYFLLFYPLTIVWEELRVAERYGAAHRDYAARTPLLLPVGAFRRGEFRWSVALRKGGGLMISLLVLSLAGVEFLARTVNP